MAKSLPSWTYRLRTSKCCWTTINTHLGLFRYTALPFGVSVSSSIFQQTVDTILNGLKGVSDILYDLIVTGANDTQHLCNLEETLQKSNSEGVRLKRSKCTLMKPSVEYFAFVALLPLPENGPGTQAGKERESFITCKRILGMSQSYCIRHQGRYVNVGNMENSDKKSYIKITV